MDFWRIKMKKVEVNVFESGDVVLLQTGENGFKNNIGMILKRQENGNYAVLSVYNSVYKEIKPSWIISISDVEAIRNEIISSYEEKIVELQSQIRKVTQEEKDAERLEKYESLKKQILGTAKNLINYKDDDDFENKLKAISDMKRAIFSIDLDCASDIRKANGRIKWKIREEISVRDSLLRNISDENIEKAFDFK